MVGPCGPNVVDGPLSWLSTGPVIFGQGFLATFASQSLEQSKSLLQISYPAFNGLTKAKRQSVFHRNLGGDVGRHRFPSPRTLTKMAPVPKGTGAIKTILMERATRSPRICIANPCFAAGLRPLRAALENAHAFSQLRTLADSIPVARSVNENSSDPQRKPKPLKQFLWSGRRESNPRHQLGRLGFYH